jgi:hypothetical protein
MSPECFRLRRVRSPHSNPKQVGLGKSSEVRAALLDLKHLILSLASCPTHVSELVKHEPNVAGACDEERGLDTAISRRRGDSNGRADVVELCKKGKLTNSDLETAAVLLQHLVAEQLCPLDQRHAATWSDNAPTVSWSAKMADQATAPIAGQLLRALAMRQCTTGRHSPQWPIMLEHSTSRPTRHPALFTMTATRGIPQRWTPSF